MESVPALSEPSRTLSEIRSDACNKILLMLGMLAVPGVVVIAGRLIEQGWQWIMMIYVVLLGLLIAVTLRRHSLSLALRAATVTVIPFAIGAASVLASGRLAGTLMFFVSACVLAGCFFGRRAAHALLALCVTLLAATFVAFRLGWITPHLVTDAYTLSFVTWFSVIASLVFAGAAPINAIAAISQALEAERLRANTAAETRTAFLANMSHELRTPMAGVIGLAEVLRDADLKESRETAAANLIRAGRNLMAVLNDLLDFARFETGQIPIERAPFRLSDMAGDLCTAFDPAVCQKHLAFRVAFPDAFTDALMGDGHRIHQVLSNLIDNAVKFTADGAVTLTIAQVQENGRLLLKCTVSDTGIGIPQDQQARIFEPFVQGESSISRRFGGSGLGLTICRMLAGAMGGALSLASTPGQGAVFTLTVPVEAAPPEAAAAQAPALSGRARNLLAAEDDANMRLILEIKLAQMGYAFTIVGDGAAALKEAATGAYHCILMDMHMPVMNGPDAVRAIRAAEAASGRARIPIIALTADLIPERVRSFREAGVDDIAGKPVNWSAVAAQIQQLVAGE